MRSHLKWTPLLALLVSACSDLAQSDRRDGEAMVGLESEPDDPEPASPPAPAQSCEVLGQTYPHGSSIPSGDRCTRCTCDDGSPRCAAAACEPVACDLILEPSDGVCSRSALDPCIFQDPDCGPGADSGGDAGTNSDAGAGTGTAVGSCEVAGQIFPDESEVPSGDDCNTCSCNDGSVACTERACDLVFCAEFVEEPDALCARFPLDPCMSQDPDCVSSGSTSAP